MSNAKSVFSAPMALKKSQQEWLFVPIIDTSSESGNWHNKSFGERVIPQALPSGGTVNCVSDSDCYRRFISSR